MYFEIIMETATVGQLTTGIRKIGRQQISTAYIYLFRDQWTIFYVGYAVDVSKRFKTHQTDALGMLIAENLPVSNNWIIETYTLLESKLLVHQTQQPAAYLAFSDLVDNPDLTRDRTDKWWKPAERAFLWHYRPCLNGWDNPSPTPLPEERYVINSKIRTDRALFDRYRQTGKAGFSVEGLIKNGCKPELARSLAIV